MKTIVAATDFSLAANQAARVAARLAQRQKATLVLMNAFHFWPTNPAETGGNFVLSAQAMRDESRHALNQLARELHKSFGQEIPIRCVVKEGYTIPSICEVAEQEKADLVVMSIVGTAPQGAQLMGSVATEMIAETNVPLLLIPPSGNFADVKNVVLSLDLTIPPDAVVLDTVLRLARQFECVVNVLCIHNNHTDATLHAKAEHIRHLMSEVPHMLTIQPGEEVYETLLTFAHTNKADLIMMLPQEHNWFRRLFMEGETQRVARLTDIPLLAVV
jgi:nucleotide-binding universal stress UspA family protein